MFRLSLCAAVAATGGLAIAQDLAPIPAPPASPYAAPAPMPAPAYQPAPNYRPSPSYEPAPIAAPSPGYAPTYRPAPVYAPTHDPVPVFPAASAYGPVAPVVPGPRPRVRYEDLRNIAPCAVTQTVCVNGECGPVYIDICAPEGCVEVKRKRNKTRFDYGKYAVDIKEKNGVFTVDYDD